MAQESHADTAPSPDSAQARTRRRRAPSAAEQKRREQWGREWGAKYAAHAKTLTPKGR